MADAEGVGRSAKPELATIEDTVDRADDRRATRVHGGESEELHAGQPGCQIGRRQPPFRRNDRAQVRTRLSCDTLSTR